MQIPAVLNGVTMFMMTFVVVIAMIFALSRHRPVIEFAGFAVIITYQVLQSLLWIYLLGTTGIRKGETIAQSFDWWGMGWFPTLSSLAGLTALLITLYLGIRAQRPNTGYSPRQRICIAAATLCAGYGAVVCANTHSTIDELIKPAEMPSEE